MREPQLKDFLAELEQEDFTLVQLLVYGNRRNNDAESLAHDKITQTLWFLDESRAGSVADAIIRNYRTKDNDFDYLTTVTRNLTKLYPLSQGVVLRILASFSESSEGVMDGMYVGREILDCLDTLINKFTSNEGAATYDWQKYEKEVKELKAKIKDCDDKRDKASSFKRERDRLLKELEQKKKESSKEAQEAELDRLKKEIKQIEDEDAKLREEIGRKTEERRKLKAQLQDIQKDVEPTGEKRTLKRLLDNLPALDREDAAE